MKTGRTAGASGTFSTMLMLYWTFHVFRKKKRQFLRVEPTPARSCCRKSWESVDCQGSLFFVHTLWKATVVKDGLFFFNWQAKNTDYCLKTEKNVWILFWLQPCARRLNATKLCWQQFAWVSHQPKLSFDCVGIGLHQTKHTFKFLLIVACILHLLLVGFELFSIVSIHLFHIQIPHPCSVWQGCGICEGGVARGHRDTSNRLHL